MGQGTVVLLMGPTGAGKTDAALTFAARRPAEIVSVDSAMVYRGLDIGTAKPDPSLRARFAHHLIDIRDPREVYSVGQFLRDARAAVVDIHARGRLPVLAGGTMLYFHALLNGLAELPEGDAQLRREIDARAAREGWAAIHAELGRLDPEAAARIHPNDPQRLQRALEVCWLTGAPLSRLQAARRSILEGWKILRVVLCPADRAVLHARIASRLQDMMNRGFLEEVRGLRARADLSPDLPALRAVGYRQLWGHLDGVYSLQEAVDRSLVATRQLAKRQLTWLRSLSGAHWVDSGDTTVAQWIDTLC